jgi:hypothetical protein
MLSRERTDDARVRALLDDAVEDPGERELGALLRELRADAPAAPAGLRAHVGVLGDWEERHPARPTRSPRLRAALAVAAVLVLATVVGGLVQGVDMGGGGGDQGAVSASGGGDGGDSGSMQSAQEGAAEGSARRDTAAKGDAAAALGEESVGRATLPPSRTRAQDYRAALRLHVENSAELSRKTKRALALTRSYGGYVVAVDYDTGAEGTSRLELRVPIGRIQDAIVDYSELGSILAQDVQIRDLQGGLDRRSQTIDRHQERIAEIRATLLAGGLDVTERSILEAELAERRDRVDALRREQAAVRERASMARVSLELTTFDEAPPVERGGLEGALRDAGGILLKELALIMYGLIVAVPVLVLGLIAFLGLRLTRRRADERLLERA